MSTNQVFFSARGRLGGSAKVPKGFSALDAEARRANAQGCRFGALGGEDEGGEE